MTSPVTEHQSHVPLLNTNRYANGPFANGGVWRLGFNPRTSHTKDLKMLFDAALLNTASSRGRIDLENRMDAEAI